MTCNKKIIQHIKKTHNINRIHIIGVYRNKVELNCSYINDCDILLKEDTDFNVFCFQLFNSYTNNTKKHKTIELISESEKKQEQSKQLYETQQSVLKLLHNKKDIFKYQKSLDILFKKFTIPKRNISYEILNIALLITCLLKDNLKLETVISILIIEFNLENRIIKRHLRLAIIALFDISENQDYLYKIFRNLSEEVPSTKNFLIEIRNYINECPLC